jgi:hypothetical protein
MLESERAVDPEALTIVVAEAGATVSNYKREGKAKWQRRWLTTGDSRPVLRVRVGARRQVGADPKAFAASLPTSEMKRLVATPANEGPDPPHS